MPPLHEMRAERAAAANYERNRAAVMHGAREKLRKLGVEPPHQEIDAAYNAAWNSLMSLLASGKQVEGEVGWLITTTFRRVIDWIRPEHWDEREANDIESDSIAEMLADDDESLDRYVDQQRQMRSLLEAVHQRFSPRETQILFYAYVLDMPRPEIARQLDIPLKRLNKLLDGYEVRPGRAGNAEAVRAHGLKEELARYIDVIASGDWCSTHGSLIRAHALGWFDPDSEKHKAATAHLQGCASCRRYYQAKRGITMLLPPVSLPVLDSSHGTSFFDPVLGLVRSIGDAARSAFGLSGTSEAVVATGAGAGGTAVAGTLLGGAGAKLVAGCVSVVVGVCVATIAVPSPDHAPTAQTTNRQGAPVQAASDPLPAPPPSASGTGATAPFVSGSLLEPDGAGQLGGLRLYDFVFENQGNLPRRHQNTQRRRRHAPRATQARPAPTPAPAPAPAPVPDSAAAAPPPSATQPAPAQPSRCEFSFEC